jgi:hypothetical protein
LPFSPLGLLGPYCNLLLSIKYYPFIKKEKEEEKKNRVIRKKTEVEK